MVPRHPGGQKSTILTTMLLPLHGFGTPWFVAPVHLTLYFLPQAALLSQMALLAAAIITPSFLYPLHEEAASQPRIRSNTVR